MAARSFSLAPLVAPLASLWRRRRLERLEELEWRRRSALLLRRLERGQRAIEGDLALTLRRLERLEVKGSGSGAGRASHPRRTPAHELEEVAGELEERLDALQGNLAELEGARGALAEERRSAAADQTARLLELEGACAELASERDRLADERERISGELAALGDRLRASEIARLELEDQRSRELTELAQHSHERIRELERRLEKQGADPARSEGLAELMRPADTAGDEGERGPQAGVTESERAREER